METQFSRAKPQLACVTGAGHRLGRAIALGFGRAGYAVGIHYYHSRVEAEQTADEVSQLGVPAILLQADLTDENQVNQLFHELALSGYRLSVFVNSASEMVPGSLDDLSVIEWDRQLALNLRAPWLCARSAARLMHPAGGVIINITDAGAGKAWTRYPVYTISKAGLEVLTRLLARSLAPLVRVNAVAPGLVIPPASLSREEWQHLVERVPLKKPVLPESVVEAVLFLAGNQDITGQTLVVDGGYQLK